jgi:hypothetical protein
MAARTPVTARGFLKRIDLLRAPEDDQNVVGAELLVRTGIVEERPIFPRVPHGDDDEPGLGGDLSLGQSLSYQTGLGGDAELLQPQLELLVSGYDVQEADHLRTEEDRRHAASPRNRGADDVVRARLVQLPDPFLLGRPSHHLEVGAKPLGAQADEEVGHVVREGRDQAAGRPDERFVEGFVPRGVGLDDEDVLPHRSYLLGALQVPLDHHVGDVRMDQLPNHLEPHATRAANDDMVFQLHHLPPGLSKSNHVREIHLDDRRGDQGEPKTHRGDPSGQKESGDESTLVGEGPDLIVSDGREGDDRHVEGIGERPARKLQKRDRPDDRKDAHDQHHQKGAAEDCAKVRHATGPSPPADP